MGHTQKGLVKIILVARQYRGPTIAEFIERLKTFDQEMPAASIDLIGLAEGPSLYDAMQMAFQELKDAGRTECADLLSRKYAEYRQSAGSGSVGHIVPRIKAG